MTQKAIYNDLKALRGAVIYSNVKFQYHAIKRTLFNCNPVSHDTITLICRVARLNSIKIPHQTLKNPRMQ